MNDARRPAAPAAVTSVLAKKLLLVTGKGGIGKSLVAAALGQLAAESGKRTLLVESAALDQLAPLFGKPEARHAETPVAPNLWCINLDPSQNFRDYVVKHLGQPRLFDKVFSHRLVQSFIDTVPGLAELMSLGRLYYEVALAEKPYDLVVYDGAASGHFLSLMTTPDAVLQSNLGGPLAKETERVKAFLMNPEQCGILYVGVPEDLVVSETLDFLPQLRERAPARLAAVVMNRVPPWDAAAFGPVKSQAGTAGSASAYLAHQAAGAERALATLRAGLDALAGDGLNLPLWRLPDLGYVDEPIPAGFAARFFGALP